MAAEKKEIIETKEPVKSVPLLQLFRYATGYDYLLMSLGSLFALANGATLPLMTIFLGDILTALILFDGTDVSKLDTDVKDGVLKMTIIGAATLVCSYLQMSLWMLSGENQSKRIREAYFKSILRQDIGWFDTMTTGDLTNRLSRDINLIQEGISDKVGLMLQFSSTFITGFIVAYTKGWQLALVLTGTLPLLAGVAVMIGKIVADGSGKEQTAYAGAGGVAQQVISSIKTVVAFAGEEKEIKRYCEKLDEAEKEGVRKAFYNGTGIGAVQLLVFLVYALAFWYGNTLVPDVLLPGQVLNVIFAIIIGAFSLGNATPHISALGTAMGAAYTIFDTIERKSPIDCFQEKGEKLQSVNGQVVFRNIDFHYPTRDDVPVLKNFSLTVHPGKTVALVGSSGSGKSTIVKLLERFYDPVSGSVSLDGVEIPNLNVHWLRQQIGIVSQEPCLFDTTIRENVLFGLMEFELLSEKEQDQKVEQALRKANAWDFIQQLPKKLDTQVGEAGGMLSGGQKQRIAIARAIIKEPKILLLDEATSALDTESERVVQAALEKASIDRTTIVIAHRLSTVKNADWIVAMSKGEIVEQGTHEQLIANGGMYADLVQSQSLKTRTDESAVEQQQSVVASEKSKVVSEKLDHGVVVVKSSTDAIDEQNAALLANYKIDYARLWGWNKQEFPWFFFGILGALANGAAQPLFALLFSDMLTILGSPKANDFALLFVALAAGAFFANFAQISVFQYAGEKMTRRVREACFKALLRQEMGFFDDERNSTGALTGKLAEDSSLLQGLTGQTAGSIVQAVGGVVTGLVIAFTASWRLSLLVLAMVPLIGAAGYLQMQSLVGYGDKTRVAYETTNQKANEAIQNIRTISTITQEGRFYNIYVKSIGVPHQMSVQGAFVSSFGFAFSQSILHFAWATSFFYGAELMKMGLNDAGDVLTAMFSIIFTAMAAGQVSNFMPNAAKAKLAAMEIFTLLDRPSAIDVTKEIGEQRETSEGLAEGKDLQFSYPSRPTIQILKGLNILAKPGMTVALVGRSGCGKSTVMGLLLRWYDYSGGRLDYDGLNVQSWNLRSLRSFLGLVGQEPVLFNTTIRDNIAYGVDTLPSELDIHNAAKAANIHEFVMSLPLKYDTLVGESGGKLSGGQKQRIAIARALIRNPKLLLLDEATSALDSESEVVVQEALDAAAKGRTTLVIAHRLSTIQNADLILVVDEGKIAESGTHFDLIDHKGRYAELVKQQNLH